MMSGGGGGGRGGLRGPAQSCATEKRGFSTFALLSKEERAGKTPRSRECHILDWRAFRRLCHQDTSGGDFLQLVVDSARAATVTTTAQLQFFPEQQSGFRCYRCTADSIADVVATLEDAKACGDVAMLVLLDVESAFDGLPHTVVEAAMDGLGIIGCLRGFVTAFLEYPLDLLVINTNFWTWAPRCLVVGPTMLNAQPNLSVPTMGRAISLLHLAAVPENMVVLLSFSAAMVGFLMPPSWDETLRYGSDDETFIGADVIIGTDVIDLADLLLNWKDREKSSSVAKAVRLPTRTVLFVSGTPSLDAPDVSSVPVANYNDVKLHLKKGQIFMQAPVPCNIPGHVLLAANTEAISCLDASFHPENLDVAENAVLHRLLLIKRNAWITGFQPTVEKNAAVSLSGVGPSARRNAAPAPAGRARMADDDASATIGATTPIEKNPQREYNATDLSQKKTLDNGGWFTAKHHNSRLIAVPETGTAAVDKSASSQPKLKANSLRQEKLPPLPKSDFKVIIRPKNGLNISQLSTHQMARAITKACGNPDMCNEGNLLIRLRNGSNIAIISTPSMEIANVVQSVPSLHFGANAVTAYVAAPDNSCKGVIHGLDAGTTPTELLAHLRVRTQGVKILYARMLGNSQTAVITFEGKIVPRYAYYYGGETLCYLYRSSWQVCYICFKPGHRADVCPTPDAIVCSNCAEPVIEDGHTCEPRKPRSPRARKQEEPDAKARNAGGRGRTKKRWFSRDSSSTSRSRSRSRSASKTRQAPETKKKQQKKTIAKKEEDSKVSWKAHLFPPSPTAPKNTNTQNDEVNELRQTIQTLRAENAELRQKLNELIDELKALRTGQPNSNPQTDETQSATIGRQEFTTSMVAMNNALANLSNLVSNLQEEARKDRERLVQFTGMKSRTKPYNRPSADHGELP
ncbi:hypothetical protein HPB49_012642 [Dermacentor silvarum]|uniref:Uncharacterized protein n=1 Tax=Dermacentor silvarum TaxID=543639 RepID=A0ACB8CXE6_DERSI|nr:hypothetical protein HPB49_012642 [Dermacentor silvarum]